MTKAPPQSDVWSGAFGAAYTARNTFDGDELDAFYLREWGVTRADMNRQVIGGLDRGLRILEVGCNIGNQLSVLTEMGFRNLYAIELQADAARQARERVPAANIVQGSAFDIPFKDGWFDLVFTSGVLIHIAPDDLPTVMREVHRCTRRYVWGFEYYETAFREIPYRGHAQLMWKGPYCARYREVCPNLAVVTEARFPYTYNDNVDAMFLLEKSGVGS